MEVKKMNTQEAIEWLEVEKQMSYNDRTQKCTREVITLLQQGEKYRQMWEEFKGKARGYNAINQIYLMEDLQQKYFPKEAKRGSYFYECTSEEIYHLKKIPLKEAKE